jgi:hypothetical protein
LSYFTECRPPRPVPLTRHRSLAFTLTASHHKFVMVFIVGGATFEEAKLVHELNAANEGQRIVLGGTSILNSNECVCVCVCGAQILLLTC